MSQYEIARKAGDFDQNLPFLKQRKVGFDVEVIFNEERIPLHSIVLGESSHFFDVNLFSTPLVPKCLTLEGMDSEVTKAVFEYFYMGKIKLLQKDVIDVLKVAHSLMAELLIKDCSNILKSTVDSGNCIEIWSLAIKLRLHELEEEAFDYIKNNFIEITKDFLQFDFEDLIKFLKSNPNDCFQDKSLALIKQWVMYDQAVRTRYLIHLLEFVQLEQLSIETLTSESTDICTDKQCLILFINAIAKQAKKVNCNTAGQSGRLQKNIVIAIGGWNEVESNIIELYDTCSNTWTTRKLDINNKQFSSVYVDQKIYVIGGLTESVVNTMECYDIKAWKQSTLSPMYEARNNFTSIVVDDFIYAIGGHGAKGLNLSSMEKYNVKTNKWTRLNSMPTPRRHIGSAVVNGEIYVVGGYNGIYLSVNECYKISTGKWRTCKQMLENQSSCGVATCRGLVYAVGGCDADAFCDKSSVERYDPKIDTWKHVKTMSSPRRGVATANFYNTVIVSGGANLMELNTVEQYDPENDIWISLPVMNNTRSSHNMIIVS